jgi:hypothetical protein
VGVDGGPPDGEAGGLPDGGVVEAMPKSWARNCVTVEIQPGQVTPFCTGSVQYRF